jgi:membrane associated rhomboid family serine protease
MFPSVFDEAYNLLHGARALLWPRAPQNAPRLLLPIAALLLPLMYAVTPFFIILDTTCLSSLGALYANGSLTVPDPDGPRSASFGLNQILSGVVPLCPSIYTQLTWGGFITGYYHEPVRFFSYVLYHASLTHLFSNWVFLLALLYYLEARYGTFQTGACFIVSQVGAVLLSTWLTPVQTILIGASGGIYGLVSMLLVDTWVNLHWALLPRLQIVFVVIMWVVVAIQDILGMPGIDSNGHWGGLVAGLGWSLLALPRFVIAVPDSLKARWWIVRIGVPYVLGAVLVLLELIVLPSVLFTA